MDKRKLILALGFVGLAGLFCLLAGGDELGVIGLLISIGGAIDLLFIRSSMHGYVASEVYGEPGEELWEFRSLLLLGGGPFVSLYPVLFGS